MLLILQPRHLNGELTKRKFYIIKFHILLNYIIYLFFGNIYALIACRL